MLALAGGAISCILDSVTSKGDPSNRSTFSTDGLMSNFGGGVGGGGEVRFLDTNLKGLASWKNDECYFSTTVV